MMRISPRNWGSRSRTDEHGTILRRLGVSFIALVVSLASVLAMSVAAGACTTISATLSTTPAVIGTSATDGAKVSGTSGTPAGTVTFTLYSGTSPSGKLVTGYTADTVILTGGQATSASTGTLAVGSYYFMVSYSGNATYSSATSTAEPFCIAFQTATLSTTPAVTGTSATDGAKVSGTSGMPTGTVTFTLYSGTSPSGKLVTGYTADTVTLVNGGATSVSTGTLTPGSYYFMVSYSGNATYSSAASTAEPFSIAFQTATLSTTPAVTGLSATDGATVSGTSGMPTGTVTFTLYSGTSPSGTLVTGYTADTVTLVNGGATSVSTGTLTPGSYYFMVSYSGNATYSSATSTAEPFSIAFQTATLATTPNVTGLSATDGATVSGTSGMPTGTVTFTLYSGSPTSGGTLVTGYTADTVGLTSGQATSASTGTLAAGSYYFMVSYSGNATYSAITGTVELFIITPSSASTTPKTGTSAYKIPTSAPQTGAGGSAGVTFNAGLLSIGSLMLLAGLGVMGFMLRRRRNA